jgi:hypothetical protein
MNRTSNRRRLLDVTVLLCFQIGFTADAQLRLPQVPKHSLVSA